MKPGEWKGTCLIVDDEADIREIMAMHASWLGFNFLEAADGEQALAALRSQPVDIVISDLMMPRMPGMRLLEAMRKEGYNMPFIFLTAFASKDVTIQALRLGAFDFLEKPFEATAVRNTLAEAMRLSQDQKRLENKVSSSSDTGEIVPEKQVEIAIMRLRSLKYAVGANELEATSTAAMASHRKLINLFADEALPQLIFCDGSIRALATNENRSFELGYIFRVMQSIRTTSETLNLTDVASLAKIAEECFAHFRVRPSLLDAEKIALLSEASAKLKQMVELLDLEDIATDPAAVSVGEVMQRLTDLCRSLQDQQKKSA